MQVDVFWGPRCVSSSIIHRSRATVTRMNASSSLASHLSKKYQKILFVVNLEPYCTVLYNPANQAVPVISANCELELRLFRCYYVDDPDAVLVLI
jgi:hypothetical protein